MKLKTAIIGMGRMGRIRYNELIRHDGFEVVAICDKNSDVKDEFPNIEFRSDWRDVFVLKLDAVFVCTYNNITPQVVCEALGYGLHVFSEKPPGRNVSDIEAIIKAEKLAENKVLKFGFNHRFHYAIMEAKAMVDSGKYGEIMWARGVYGKAGGLDFETSWRSNKEISGGGILLDQGIHMLDLLLYFMGDFIEIKSMVENTFWKNTELEDNAFALMKTDTGKVAMLHSSATQWRHKFLLEIFMEHGYVIVSGILSSTRSYGDETLTIASRQFENEAKAFGKPSEQIIYYDKDDSWKLEVDEFYNKILNANTTIQGSSLDALNVMKLIEEIYAGQ